ncbi:MAG: hypothetical protein FWC50_00350, partial [Planctomycetaceae bacterium]|nr:hypothetical protein [Planctomycetaceae bacterium]
MGRVKKRNKIAITVCFINSYACLCLPIFGFSAQKRVTFHDKKQRIGCAQIRAIGFFKLRFTYSKQLQT